VFDLDTRSFPPPLRRPPSVASHQTSRPNANNSSACPKTELSLCCVSLWSRPSAQLMTSRPSSLLKGAPALKCAVTDLQGLKFFDRPLMLAFSRGGASESPEKVQPTPPAASAASAAQWREREEQTPLTTDEEDQVTAALLHCLLLNATLPTRCDQGSPLTAADYRLVSLKPASSFALTSFAAESAPTQ
jgi:hypothetical protein